jgi:serine/threonine protein kinase/Flp pilus assembly protein TadD
LSTNTPSAQDLVADVLQRWAQGHEPDAQAALKEHPQLANDHEALTDLAFGEFCQRLDRGEFVNPQAFASRFPACRSTLFRIMNGHQLTVDNPGLLADPPRKKWPEPGEQFVGFRVVRELGRGAFARVYLATEPALGGRWVVLKVGMQGNAEAEILGRLGHDNIVPVHAMREDLLTGMTVVCMPYLGASTLADVLEHVFARPRMPANASILLDAVRPRAEEEEILGPLKPSPILISGTYVEGVLDMGIQLAEALAFVHKRKIYHRDLKPSNVLVRPDGRPMLLDFNLSFDEQAAQQTLGGTLIYMAPEMLQAIESSLAERTSATPAESSLASPHTDTPPTQLSFAPPTSDTPLAQSSFAPRMSATEKGDAGVGLVGGRSDLYSLGIILYEMLSGEHPFEQILWGKSAEGNRQRLMELQKTARRPLRCVNPRVDRKVAGIVDRCLSYDPDARYPSATELARALRGCLSWPQRWRRRLARHPYAVLGTGLAAILLVAAFVVFTALREPYAQRELKEGLHAFERGQYAEAIDHLSLSLADEESSEAYMTRGRAYLKIGELKAAEDDLILADKLDPTGQTQAALGYCYNAMQRHQAAASCYRIALSRNFKTAVIFNNLGYSLAFTEGRDAEAAEFLRQAIKTDPGLQMAYYNLAGLQLKKAWNNRDLVSPEGLKEGVAAIARAIELGPAPAKMHVDAAHLWVLAEKIEPAWKEKALEHLSAAIDRGLTPTALRTDKFLLPLRGEQFRRLTERAAVQVPQTPIVRVLDPLEQR